VRRRPTAQLAAAPLCKSAAHSTTHYVKFDDLGGSRVACGLLPGLAQATARRRGDRLRLALTHCRLVLRFCWLMLDIKSLRKANSNQHQLAALVRLSQRFTISLARLLLPQIA